MAQKLKVFVAVETWWAKFNPQNSCKNLEEVASDMDPYSQQSSCEMSGRDRRIPRKLAGQLARSTQSGRNKRPFLGKVERMNQPPSVAFWPLYTSMAYLNPHSHTHIHTKKINDFNVSNFFFELKIHTYGPPLLKPQQRYAECLIKPYYFLSQRKTLN